MTPSITFEPRLDKMIFSYAKTKDADQLCAQLRSVFVSGTLPESEISTSSYILLPPATLLGCTARFVSDQVGKPRLTRFCLNTTHNYLNRFILILSPIQELFRLSDKCAMSRENCYLHKQKSGCSLIGAFVFCWVR